MFSSLDYKPNINNMQSALQTKAMQQCDAIKRWKDRTQDVPLKKDIVAGVTVLTLG